MNKKVRNFKQLDHPIHHFFLSNFQLIILVAILLFSLSLWKAQTDLKRIADRMKARINAPAERGVVILYRVKTGESIDRIADQFDLYTQSVKWANEDLIGVELKKDMIIRIPPVDGVVHEVKVGETTELIAHEYQVSKSTITDYPYNTFSDEEKNLPTIGQTLMVPGGIKTSENVLGEFWKRVSLVQSALRSISFSYFFRATSFTWVTS
jgi:uncharacterized protein (DUF433 family)